MAELFRDNAREEYWYQQGRYEMAEWAQRNLYGDSLDIPKVDGLLHALNTVVRNARAQIDPEPRRFYNE